MEITDEDLLNKFCIYMTDLYTEYDCKPCPLYMITLADCTLSSFAPDIQEGITKKIKSYIESKGYEIEDFVKRIELRTICASNGQCEDPDMGVCGLKEMCKEPFDWYDKKEFPPEKIDKIYQNELLESS